MEFQAVKLNNVYYRYDKDSQDSGLDNVDNILEDNFALKGLSLTINQGEFVAFLGHNGSGKSTAAKLLNGLITPDSGTVEVLGINTSDPKTIFDVRKNVGMVFQNPDNQMIASIVEDDIAFGPENIGIPPDEIVLRVDWALKSVGMESFRESTSHRLSGGQKQRIAIAGVLAIKPKILVLDESTAMLDPIGRQEVMEVIRKLNKEQGITVILITHFMEEAALADKIFVFNDGEAVLSGTPREVFKNFDYLKSIGLAVPFATGVAKHLREKGLYLEGDILNTEELFESLCRLL